MNVKIKAFLKLIEPWHVMLGLVISIVGGFFAARAWVQSVARDSVLDERFLVTLSTRVRPICIFDTRGAIEADLGAMEYIDDIKVIPAPAIFGFEVVIKAKRHLAYAPLVTGLDLDVYPQSATRGKLHVWSIVLSPQSTTSSIITEDPMDTNKVHRFKLEILH